VPLRPIGGEELCGENAGQADYTEAKHGIHGFLYAVRYSYFVATVPAVALMAWNQVSGPEIFLKAGLGRPDGVRRQRRGKKPIPIIHSVENGQRAPVDAPPAA